MKIVLAPDSFKESMTAKEVCAAMTEGIRKVFETDLSPVADGFGNRPDGCHHRFVDGFGAIDNPAVAV